MAQLILLTDAHRKASVLAGTLRPYFASYDAVMRGLVAAERVGQRLFVDEAAVPVLVEYLAKLPPPRHRKAA